MTKAKSIRLELTIEEYGKLYKESTEGLTLYMQQILSSGISLQELVSCEREIEERVAQIRKAMPEEDEAGSDFAESCEVFWRLVEDRYESQ